MGSVTKHIELSVEADGVWAGLRDVNPHHVFAPVLTDVYLEGGTRTTTFANGLIVSERIFDVDDDARRFAYSIVGGAVSDEGMAISFIHHHGSFAVTEADGGGSTVTWVIDLLPDDLSPMVEKLMDQGSVALAATLEG